MLRLELGGPGLVEVVRVVKLMAAVRSPWFQSVEVCGGGRWRLVVCVWIDVWHWCLWMCMCVCVCFCVKYLNLYISN